MERVGFAGQHYCDQCGATTDIYVAADGATYVCGTCGGNPAPRPDRRPVPAGLRRNTENLRFKLFTRRGYQPGPARLELHLRMDQFIIDRKTTAGEYDA